MLWIDADSPQKACTMTPTPLADELTARAWTALAAVQDPEMGESLGDLGVIGGIELDGEILRVRLVPTSATCPMADVMLNDAELALQPICPSGVQAQAILDWETVWSPERMSPALRERFGW